jgi:ascorbate-specific PTS system EIIC-type component UlaA
MRRIIGLILVLSGAWFVYDQDQVVQKAMHSTVRVRSHARGFNHLGIDPNSVIAEHQDRIDSANNLATVGGVVVIIGLLMIVIPKRK